MHLSTYTPYSKLQASAALSATAYVLQDDDPAYAKQLISVANGLYQQAKEQEGFYSDSVPEVSFTLQHSAMCCVRYV